MPSVNHASSVTETPWSWSSWAWRFTGFASFRVGLLRLSRRLLVLELQLNGTQLGMPRYPHWRADLGVLAGYGVGALSDYLGNPRSCW